MGPLCLAVMSRRKFGTTMTFRYTHTHTHIQNEDHVEQTRRRTRSLRFYDVGQIAVHSEVSEDFRGLTSPEVSFFKVRMLERERARARFCVFLLVSVSLRAKIKQEEPREIYLETTILLAYI